MELIIKLMLSNFYVKKQFFVQSHQSNIKDYYQFLEVKGRGAFGVVYKAKLKYYPYMVRAIKRIKKVHLKTPDHIINQFMILTSLDHPKIIKIYETFEDKQNFFLVLDYCQGGELFKRLEKQGNFTQTVARQVFSQMVNIISYCHHNNVAHRDLKPQNFLLTDQKSLDIMLIDFGLSFKWKIDMKKQNIIKPNSFIGTAYYMSPQVVKCFPYNQSCDVWSLGIILFMMVTGQPPMKGATSTQIRNNVKLGHINLKTLYSKQLNPKLVNLVESMLKPESSRITIKQILQHPWMHMNLPKEKMNINFERIRQFSQLSNFKILIMNFLASQLPQKQIQKLGKVFMQIDVNNDGFLTVQELTGYMKVHGKQKQYKEISQILSSIDLDKTGAIAYNQFISACLSKAASNNIQYLRFAFRFFDLNGDGKISKKQLQTVLKSYQKQFAENTELIERLVQDCDVNGDNQIDFDEFCKYLLKDDK